MQDKQCDRNNKVTIESLRRLEIRKWTKTKTYQRIPSRLAKTKSKNTKAHSIHIKNAEARN